MKDIDIKIVTKATADEADKAYTALNLSGHGLDPVAWKDENGTIVVVPSSVDAGLNAAALPVRVVGQGNSRTRNNTLHVSARTGSLSIAPLDTPPENSRVELDVEIVAQATPEEARAAYKQAGMSNASGYRYAAWKARKGAFYIFSESVDEILLRHEFPIRVEGDAGQVGWYSDLTPTITAHVFDFEGNIETLAPSSSTKPAVKPEASKFTVRPTKLVVIPTGETVFALSSFVVAIEDEGAGEFVEISQEREDGSKSVAQIDPDEWPAVRSAINRMFREIAKHS